MRTDPVSVLLEIVEEVAGAGQPFSADSYLPAHLIHDARQAIEEAQADVPASALEAHETILRTRLAKADEMISGLRSEIDSLRIINASAAGPVRSALQEASESVLEFRLQKADEMIASLRAEIDSLLRPNIPGQPPTSMFVPETILFDPYERLTAYGRHPECDA